MFPNSTILNPLYPIVPNGISALFDDKTYFWHARRTAIARRLELLVCYNKESPNNLSSTSKRVNTHASGRHTTDKSQVEALKGGNAAAARLSAKQAQRTGAFVTVYFRAIAYCCKSDSRHRSV